MADKNIPDFAVSVTPKVSVDAEAGVFQAMTVIHEDVRKTLGGGGTVTGTGVVVEGGTGGSWANGTYTQLTNSSNAGAIANDASTDLVFIKHLGTLVTGGTVSDNTTTSLLIKHDTDVISELLNGEAIVLPRPGATSALILATGNGTGGTSSNHVNVEVVLLGT
tara:strand:- start:39 stop:530 length:492 start_codon:yes stop_codon:yes gene_type:complete